MLSKKLLIKFFIKVVLLIAFFNRVAFSEVGINYEEDISIRPIPPLKSYLLVDKFIVLYWLGTGADTISAYGIYKKCSHSRVFLRKVIAKKNNKGWYKEYIPYVKNCSFEVSSIDINGNESNLVKILGQK